MMRYRTDKIAYTAMFTAVSLALYTLEGSLPVLIPVPGAKLGLSNIVIMFLVYKGMRKEAFLTLIMKLVLSVLIAGQVVSLVYGLFGGILAYFAMCLVNFIYRKKGTVICGVFSAMLHNLGQCVAAWIMGFRGLILYMPYLMVIGAVTGVFTGLICKYMLLKIKMVR